jgi:hypothetical protein
MLVEPWRNVPLNCHSWKHDGMTAGKRGILAVSEICTFPSSIACKIFGASGGTNLVVGQFVEDRFFLHPAIF